MERFQKGRVHVLGKLKGSCDALVATVSIRSGEFIEVSKIKTQITTITNEVNGRKVDLGEVVYKMFNTGVYDYELIGKIGLEIKEKEDLIVSLHERIFNLQNENSQIFGGKQGLTCSQCGEVNAAGSKFCISCGSEFYQEEKVKFCVCGAPNRDDAKFCVKCGNVLTTE